MLFERADTWGMSRKLHEVFITATTTDGAFHEANAWLHRLRRGSA